MNKKITFIFRIISKAILTFLLILIVILAAYVVYIKVMQSQNKLDKIPINMYVILTQSMYPKIKAGDMIITLSPKSNKYEVGDIITYISDNSMSAGITITHRIIRITTRDGETAYVTQGDANNAEDSPPVLTKSIIGKTILKIPKVGHIQRFIATKFGWVSVVVIPCMGIIIFDIVKIFTRRKKIGVRNKYLSGVSKEIDDEIIKEVEKPEEITTYRTKDYEEKREKDAEEDFWGIN